MSGEARASVDAGPAVHSDGPPVGTALFESGRPDADGGRSLRFERPLAQEVLAEGEDPRDLFARLQAHLDAGRWVAGALAFEAGYPLLGLPLPSWADDRLGWFGVYDGPVDGASVAPAPDDDGSGTHAFRFEPGPEAWRELVGEVQERIRAGETYQVNLTGRMRFRAERGGWAAYRAWSRRQPVPFAAYLRPESDREIVSLSPELFVRSDGVDAWTRPMKGTLPRGASAAADAEAVARLRGDPKARAENVMIVDLLRNDLGRVCAYGTVRVPHLFEVERYETLLQLTSTVRGRLRPELRGRALPAVLEALFPCGSVTGAPKRATMAAIAELERAPRGVYTGAIGHASPDGAFVFSVAIRSAEIRGRDGVLGLGSGIVIDSDPSEEYLETLLKGAFAQSS